MFTGIVTDIGTILSIENRGDTWARIQCGYDPHSIDIGASIACSGVCLTVLDRGETDGACYFDVQYSAETRAKSTAEFWAEGARLNLERALRVGDELGGHIVSGHVDGRAQVVSTAASGDSTIYTFQAPMELAKFIAPKGSVALDGTSLTVNEVSGAEFTVNLIPHTKSVTTWGTAKTGDHVNLEVDTLARYVARLNDANEGLG